MNTPSARSASHGGWFGFLIGPLFLLLAAWFVAGPETAEVPHTPVAQVRADWLTTAPRRTTIGDPPMIRINGFDRVCTDCHGLFPLGTRPIRERLQHEDIVLDHGINRSCHNCHDTKDMSRLVVYGGESIAYREVPRLCQKCHGPTFQDWERGIHGRVNGYWNPKFGDPRKLKCIECHDPHRPRVPAMDPLVPLPGPHTLRMGHPGHEGTPVRPTEEADPLRRAIEIHGSAGNGGPPPGEGR